MSEKKYYIKAGGKPVRVTEEEYRVIKRSKDKEQYFMGDLKRGKVMVDQREQTVKFRHSREISYEHLRESGWDIPSEGMTLDELMERECMREDLARALERLTAEELTLIRELFFLEKTEQELGKVYHVTQQAINKKKKKILEKLKNFLKNF